MPNVSRSESFATIDGDATESIAMEATNFGSVLISAHATAISAAAAQTPATIIAVNRCDARRRWESGIHSLDERRGDVHICLSGSVGGVARHHWLACGKCVSRGNRPRNDLLKDNVRWQVLPHVFHNALACWIPRFEHCENETIENKLLIQLNDALNSAKDLRCSLQCERLAL